MSKNPLSKSQGAVPFKGVAAGTGRRDSNSSESEAKSVQSGTTTPHPLTQSRSKKKDGFSKKSPDPFSPYIITLPKYLYGIKIQHNSLDSDVCAYVDGPSDDSGDVEGVRYEPANPMLPEIYAKAITTYPHFQGSTNPEGHPICDRYSVRATKTGTICAIADGCGWGERPKDAAQKAIQAFLSYMDSRVHKLKDVHRAGEVMLKAFREAQAAVMQHTHTASEGGFKNCLECGQCGTTTMLGGLLLPLEAHTLAMEKEQPKWGFLCCSVGDCKAFCLSRNRITEITVGSRHGVSDASDCGGRLGPQIEGEPDLRNLQLFFHPCHVNDVIFLVSDGVHDNFDPEHLGKTPRECMVPAEGWAKADKEDAMSMKDIYRTRLFEDTLSGNPTLEAKVTAVLRHCESITQSSREWMKEHKGRLPLDYDRFPGKMDHTTCVAVRVPSRILPDRHTPTGLHQSASV